MKVADITPLSMTTEHATAGIEWLQDISAREKWDLSIDEITDLLGGISLRTYRYWKRKSSAGQRINLGRDCLERISLLLGISKALQIMAPSGRTDLAYRWFNQPNDHPIFGGMSIKEYLLKRKSIGGLYTVRRYLDAAKR